MKDTTRTRWGALISPFPNRSVRRTGKALHLLEGRWIVPALLIGLVLTLYLSTLSAVHTYDALTYLRDIEQQSDFFLHPHHLLYSPTGWLFWQSWRLWGYAGTSELPLEVLNTLAAIACGLGLYSLTLRLTRSLGAALIASGIFFCSYANWYFAVEVEVYMLALVWQVAALMLLVELVTMPRPRTAPCLGLVLGLAALYHQTNGLLVPVVVAGAVLAPLRWHERLRVLVVVGLVAGGLVALGYGIFGIGIKGLHNLHAFRHWMFFYTDSGLWGHSKQGRWIDLGVGLSSTIATRGAISPWVGIVVVLLLGRAALRRWPRVVLVSAIWIGIYGAFFTWWEPDNVEFWISALLPLWLLIGLAAASAQLWGRGGAVRVGALVVLAVLGWHNYWIIDRRGDAAFDLQRRISAAVRQVTVPSDLIIEPHGVLELYLPRYEERPNVRMIHRLFWQTGNKPNDALDFLRQEVETALHAGVAVLVSREGLNRRDVDIPRQQLDAFWQSYREVLQPAVTIDGTTHFWRIPSAPNIIARGGWQWTSIDWGWQGTNIAGSSIRDGWCFNPQRDPMLVSPRLSINAESIRALEVTMSTVAPNQTAQLYYGGLDGQLAEEHSISWPVEGDGQFHTYRLPLVGAPGWDGTLTLLRLDPIALGDGTAAARTCVTSLRLVR